MNRFAAALLVLVIIAGGVFLWKYRDAPWLAPYLGSAPMGQLSTTTPPIQAGWNTFASSTYSFSIKYPSDFTPDTSYVYQEMGPGKNINGIKFTIPSSMATGTNLGSDSYISVEQIPNASSCTADQFLDLQGNGSKVQTITDNGVTYSVASSTGAGAGNRYEEWAWAIPGTSPCLAVRYFIHYGVLDNYPPGMVQQFDKSALLKTFDGIRQSLVIGK